jgi:hypothetical protein
LYAVKLNSELYSGQTANIIFSPDTGGTVDIGSVVIPYDFFVDYYYGVYSLSFPDINKNCFLYLNDHYLLLENGYNLLQEDGSTIII